LKVIDKKKMSGENEDMIEYLKGEKEVMSYMNHQNLVKLYNFKEDQEYYYMILEYCDGGDLVNLQATCPNRVFSLEDATKYLSQVTHGL
jgi:serine/threonine protein kinase